MSKKKRKASAPSAPLAMAPATLAGAAAASGGDVPRTDPAAARPLARAPALALPADITAGDWTGILMALMLFLAPALGVPNEEMLQDTLKSIVVSFAALSALLLFLWQQRARALPLRWHGVVALPLALMAYALGSMVWSHTFLGGTEAVRWFIFSVIVWLGLCCFSRERFSTLAWGIHAGALAASLWTALQFWADFKGFPQGPNPASTFVNRNFFAEFVVCTLPFSVWLLLRARGTAVIALVSFTTGFNLVAMLMTGTRSALIALLALALVLPVIVFLYGRRLPCAHWARAERAVAAGVLVATVLGLGMIGTGNAALIEENRAEGRGLTPIARSFARANSMTDRREYTERSFAMRWVMWTATGRMIAANPLRGVGAGAWEVEIPRYQASGAQLETDYYVHNEILQLLAEYGVVGWAFLLALFGYLLAAAWKTWRDNTPEGQAEAPLRAVTLTSLLLFLIVSNAGFPWRLAATGALFAVCLGVLAASDARLGWRWRQALAAPLPWQPRLSQALLALTSVCLALCVYISQQAAETERKIVHAVKLALTISQSNQTNSLRWKATKAEMFQSLREGIAINPHYRKLTPMVADEVAKWGDWKDAVWIWESVVTSRPYVVAIMSNIARGYSIDGEFQKAFDYLERCKRLQPNAPSVRSLEVILLARTGRQAEALLLAKRSLDEGIYDYDLVTAAYSLGAEHRDWVLALNGLRLRGKDWPATAVDGLLKAGRIYADAATTVHDDAKALGAFQQAYAMAPEASKAAVLADIPAPFQSRLSAAKTGQ